MKNITRKPPTAAREIKTPRIAAALALRLIKRGLGPEDARVVGHNTAAVFAGYRFMPPALTPDAVLRRLSLDEIAGLCENLVREAEEL